MTRWQGRIPLIVGVVGHRRLDPAERHEIERQTRGFFEGLRAQLPTTPIVVLSRLNGDADQLVASTALAAGCDSACLLPLEAAAYRSTLGPDAARTAFDRLLERSVVLELPGAAAHAGDTEHAYAEAGYYLVRHSTLLLAVWDGVESSRSGSVASLIGRRLANHLDRRDPTLCELPVRTGQRARSRGLSAREAIQACGWRDAEKLNAFLSSLSGPELARSLGPFAEVPDERVIEVATVCRAASRSAVKLRSSLKRCAVLLQGIAFLAAIAFAAFLKFSSHVWILWIYLGLLASALTVRTLVHRRALHRRYLDYRGLAEGLRVALFWRIAAGSRDGRSDDAALPLIGGPGDVALGWIGAALSALDAWMGRTPLPEGFDGCEFAARHWLGGKKGGDPRAQIPYYRDTASRLRRLATRVDRLVNLTLITGVVSAASLAVLPALWSEGVAPILMAVMGFMPLVSSTASAVVDVPADHEMARQYERMEHLLTSAAQRLEAANSAEERERILFEAGVATLAEQRIWLAVIGQRAPRGRTRS